jgi:hypothetical protein
MATHVSCLSVDMVTDLARKFIKFHMRRLKFYSLSNLSRLEQMVAHKCYHVVK